MFALSCAAAASRATALGLRLMSELEGPKSKARRCGGGTPPTGQTVAGGPRGQALSMTEIATKCLAASVQTASVRTALLLSTTPGGAQFKKTAPATQNTQ